MPSTPAQMFHMLRRQMVRDVAQAAGRHDAEEPAAPQAVGIAARRALSHGAFQLVIPEIDRTRSRQTVQPRRVLQRQGLLRPAGGARVPTSLATSRIVRIEQLYPFPTDDSRRCLQRYPNAREIVWCQEEPQNQGAWYQIRHRLQEPLRTNQELLYSGRAPAAAPAPGIFQLHRRSSTAWSMPRSRADPAIRLRRRPEIASRPAAGRSHDAIEVRVPQLPESVADATLVAWHKTPGDAVKRDENLVDLETDKVVLEVPAPVSGVIREIRVAERRDGHDRPVAGGAEEGAAPRRRAAKALPRQRPAAKSAAGRGAGRSRAAKPAGRGTRGRQARPVGAPPRRGAQARCREPSRAAAGTGGSRRATC